MPHHYSLFLSREEINPSEKSLILS